MSRAVLRRRLFVACCSAAFLVLALFVVEVPADDAAGPWLPEARAAAAPETAPPAAVEYRVQDGDTLFSIARRFYGTGHLWRQVARANPQAEAQRLRPGQVLLLPLEEPHQRPASPEPQPRLAALIARVEREYGRVERAARWRPAEGAAALVAVLAVEAAAPATGRVLVFGAGGLDAADAPLLFDRPLPALAGAVRRFAPEGEGPAVCWLIEWAADGETAALPSGGGGFGRQASGFRVGGAPVWPEARSAFAAAGALRLRWTADAGQVEAVPDEPMTRDP